MRCPRCGRDLGEGLLPARCPSCGQGLSVEDREAGRPGARDPLHASRSRASLGRARAIRAAASRASVEGLSGVGRGRRDSSYLVKRVVRIIVGLALVAGFCGILYVVAYQTELIGGRSVPDVVGWRADRAMDRLRDDGFMPVTTQVPSTSEVEGRVVSTDPGAQARVERGSTVTVGVSVPDTGASEGESATTTE